MTKKDCAILAAAVYRATSDEKLPSGWRRVFTSKEGTLDGLSYAVFIKSEEGKPDERVISFRGTDNWWSDGGDNIAGIEGRPSDQVYLAFKATLDILSGKLRGVEVNVGGDHVCGIQS